MHSYEAEVRLLLSDTPTLRRATFLITRHHGGPSSKDVVLFDQPLRLAHPVAAPFQPGFLTSNHTFNNTTAWATRTLFAVISILMMGETSITKNATNIKLHAQSSMERKARKEHFSKFGSMTFQMQSCQSQERRIDCEM